MPLLVLAEPMVTLPTIAETTAMAFPNRTVEIEYRIGSMCSTQRARQSSVMEHAGAVACGEHVAGPLLVAR